MSSGRRHTAEDRTVSCLMVTNRPAHAHLAIEAFRRQTHRDRELVVVDNTTDGRLSKSLDTRNDPMIRTVRVEPGVSVGVLRNVSVEHARGRFVCIWDDDDMHHPQRVQVQLQGLLDKKISVCFLEQLLMWWPHQRRLAISYKRKWENSMLCERSVLPRYPDLARGSDTAMIRNLLERCRYYAYVGWPALYIYVNHGANLWDDDHFDGFWSHSAQHFLGEDYRAVIDTLGRQLPISDYLRILGSLGNGGERGRDHDQPTQPDRPSSVPSVRAVLGRDLSGSSDGIECRLEQHSKPMRQRFPQSSQPLANVAGAAGFSERLRQSSSIVAVRVRHHGPESSPKLIDTQVAAFTQQQKPEQPKPR